MNGNVRSAFVFLAFAGLAVPGAVCAQETVRPDLSTLAGGGAWRLVNRGASVAREGERVVATLDARSGDGVAWLDGVDFRNGTIEVLLRGHNDPGRSFVGVAFRGADDETFDAVYFRPFNFVADNELSRSHMVQYISHPVYTWSRLRTEHPGVYENALPTPPDPDAFFRARIVVEKPTVRVYVGDDIVPALEVNELTDRTGGRIGLWVGNGSGGGFADLVIRSSGG